MPPERESRPAYDQAADVSTAIQTTLTVPAPPVLDAHRDLNGVYLWVWCEHELRWHRHGAACTCEGDEDGWCICPLDRGDGHRSAHCICPRSPYRDTGYVLRTVGELTSEHLRRVEVSYVHGCRTDNCRVDRAAARDQYQHPAELPPPDDPLTVAHQIVKGFCAIDWTDLNPLLEDQLWHGPWSGVDHPLAWFRDYEPEWQGPLALRRWRGGWMRWHETHWAEIEEAELTGQLWERLGGATYTKTAKDGTTVALPWKPNRRSVGEVLAALDSLVHLPAAVDAPSWLDTTLDVSKALVSCTNGLLDTNSRDLVEHDPSWFNLVSVPFDYDEHAPTPTRWLHFLADLWPDDPASIAALQEWFGYVLSGRTDLQKMFLLVGPPRSGKGTMVRILTELVGKDNYCGPTLASLGTNFGLQALIGKPLAVVADARVGGRADHIVVERLLSISGEDSLTFDRKYRDAWTGRLPTRLMVLSNELPHFGDSSGAIATRFVVLQLTNSWLGREDIGLERALMAELPGILLWALDGLTRLNAQRRFTEPASSSEAVVAMADSASPTGAFIRDRCEVGAGKEVAASVLYAAWCGWCIENGRGQTSQQTLGRSLRSVVPTVKLAQPRDPATGQQVRTYYGIGLKRGEARINPMSVKTEARGLWREAEDT